MWEFWTSHYKVNCLTLNWVSFRKVVTCQELQIEGESKFMDFSRILRDTLKIQVAMLWFWCRLSGINSPATWRHKDFNGVSLLVQTVILQPGLLCQDYFVFHCVFCFVLVWRFCLFVWLFLFVWVFLFLCWCFIPSIIRSVAGSLGCIVSNWL